MLRFLHIVEQWNWRRMWRSKMVQQRKVILLLEYRLWRRYVYNRRREFKTKAKDWNGNTTIKYNRFIPDYICTYQSFSSKVNNKLIERLKYSRQKSNEFPYWFLYILIHASPFYDFLSFIRRIWHALIVVSWNFSYYYFLKKNKMIFSMINCRFCVLLLIFISESFEALFCINAIQPIRIWNDFTLDVVEKILNNLTVDDNFETCVVEIRFYFNYQSAVILFGSAVSTSNVVEINHEVHVLMSIGITRGKTIVNPSSIIQFVKSACDYADECDRRFVLKHLQWLSKTNHSQIGVCCSSIAFTEGRLYR